MGTQVLSPAEVGRRIKLVRCAADLTGKQLGEFLGKEGTAAGTYISELEHGKRDAPPHPRALSEIAEAAVGHGDLGKEDAGAVLDFLLGVAPSLTITPKVLTKEPHLTPIEGDAEKSEERRRARRARNRDAASDADMCYSTHPRSDLLKRVA